jgi:hypothetical protein
MLLLLLLSTCYWLGCLTCSDLELILEQRILQAFDKIHYAVSPHPKASFHLHSTKKHGQKITDYIYAPRGIRILDPCVWARQIFVCPVFSSLYLKITL